ncbi:MAG: DUF4412 domain-containing protein [Bacteroidia bacterium]
MKKILLPSLAFLLLSLVSWKMFAPQTNGMVVHLKMSSSKGTSGNITIYYDTPGSRIEIAATMGAFSITKASIVKKAEPSIVYQLDEKSKTYSTVDVSNAETDKVDEPATATLIGTELLNEYSCKHVKIIQGEKKWEMWVTTSIAEYTQFSAVVNKARYIGNHGVHVALKAINAEGFPVKTILTDTDGTTTTALTGIERKPLSAALFAIPADYKKGAPAPAHQH